jgi:hypothetical protein
MADAAGLPEADSRRPDSLLELGKALWGDKEYADARPLPAHAQATAIQARESARIR